MKYFIFCFSVIAFSVSAQTFKWSAQQQVPAANSKHSIVYDKDQNAIVSGEYNNSGSPAVFGSFLTRYNRDGNLMWKVLLDRKLYIALSYDRVNNIILTSCQNFNAPGGSYINKYDLAGNELKSIQQLPMVNGGMANKIHSIAADNSGGYVIVGTYQKDFHLGQFSFADPPSQEERFFLARFNSLDSCLWVISSSAGTAFPFMHINVDSKNDILISGRPVGAFTLGTFTSSSGNSKTFLCKVDENGSVKWMTSVGSNTSGYTEITNLSTDTDNNLFVMGMFEKEIVLPCGTVNGNSDFNSDIFILKLSSSGQCQWLKRIGGINFDTPAGLTSDPVTGGILVAGTFAGQCSIDNISLISAQSSTSAGVQDAFIAKYDQTGEAKWAVALGADTCGQAKGESLAANELGDIYFTGAFKCKVRFGNHPQTSTGVNIFISNLKAIDPTGLSNWQSDRILRFFPNPTTGIVKIQTQKIDKKINISVFNVMGEKIVETVWLPENKNVFLIDLSLVRKGIYLIHYTDGELTLVHKQIVQ